MILLTKNRADFSKPARRVAFAKARIVVLRRLPVKSATSDEKRNIDSAGGFDVILQDRAAITVRQGTELKLTVRKSR